MNLVLPIRLVIGLAVAGITWTLVEIMGASSQQLAQVQIACVPSEDQLRIKSLVNAGLDDAMKDRAQNLFEVWMRDPQGQPGRAQHGLENAIKAYVWGRGQVDNWIPPPC